MKCCHESDFLKSFGKLRKNGRMFDYSIEVEDKTFPVHRIVLVACSGHFEEMFLNETKEIAKTKKLEGVSAQSVEQCINFMYSGKINLTKENAEEILQAARLLKLERVIQGAFDVMQSNISTENCLAVVTLGQQLREKKMTKQAAQYVKNNFDKLSSSPDFPFIAKPFFIHCLQTWKKDHCTTWTAIMAWLKGRKITNNENLLDFMDIIDTKNFSLEYIARTVLNEPLVQNCDVAKKNVLGYIFSDVLRLREQITPESFFPIKKAQEKYKLDNDLEVLEITNKFVMSHFKEISETEDFKQLTLENLLNFLVSPGGRFSHEDDRWGAMLLWIKGKPDAENRFYELFRTLDLKRLSPTGMIKLKAEPLVNNSSECKNVLLEYILSNPKDKMVSRTRDKRIALLNAIGREIDVFNLTTADWSNPPKIERSPYMCIVNIESDLYFITQTSLLNLSNSNRWEKKADPALDCEQIQAVVFRGCIYVVGEETMPFYDPRSDSWSKSLRGCGLESGFCVAASDEAIYAVGGMSSKGCEARRFDPDSKTWNMIRRMITGRFGASAAWYNGKIYVLGGGWYGVSYETVESYKITENFWIRVASMTIPRSSFSAIVLDQTLYAVGGERNAEQKDINSIEFYNIKLKKWSVLHTMQYKGIICACAYP
ncbi:kelch-like protein 40 [Styela clava]